MENKKIKIIKRFLIKIKAYIFKDKKVITIEIPKHFKYKHEYDYFIKKTLTLIEKNVKYDR